MRVGSRIRAGYLALLVVLFAAPSAASRFGAVLGHRLLSRRIGCAKRVAHVLSRIPAKPWRWILTFPLLEQRFV